MKSASKMNMKMHHTLHMEKTYWWIQVYKMAKRHYQDTSYVAQNQQNKLKCKLFMLTSRTLFSRLIK